MQGCVVGDMTFSFPTLEALIQRHGDKVGPRCEKSRIAGTLELAPKYIKFENGEIVRLREEKNVIVRINNHDQALSDKTNVYLFGRWRKAEQALLEEEIARTDIKECNAVRLDLFPASSHVTE